MDDAAILIGSLKTLPATLPTNSLLLRSRAHKGLPKPPACSTGSGSRSLELSVAVDTFLFLVPVLEGSRMAKLGAMGALLPESSGNSCRLYRIH